MQRTGLPAGRAGAHNAAKREKLRAHANGAAGTSRFAAKPRDLQALRDAVDQAATVSGALWLSYIFVFLYLAIAAGAVTHKDLFLRTWSNCRS